MIKRILTIGEISDILDIPASTLRFWEQKGLFHVSKGTNRYRTYTTTDLIQIADIVFYRNLGVPIKQIEEFSAIGLMEYGEKLQALQQRLADKIRAYEHMYEKNRAHQNHYHTLLQLLEKPFTVEEPSFQSIASWDFLEKDRLLQYVDDPSCYVWCKDTTRDEPGQKGIILDDSKDENVPLIWSKKNEVQFLTFPIKAVVNNDYEGLEAEHIVSQVQQHCRTGMLFSRHLLNCVENGQLVEYLKGYLEVLDPIGENFSCTLD